MNPFHNNCHPVNFAGQKLALDASGALYWPAQEMLIVSDLHLEKGSFLAQFGSVLPHYDSRDTLDKLRQVINHYQPQHVVCLGDSFHDRHALKRLSTDDTSFLQEMVRACKNWYWILGNHDSSLDASLPGITLPTLDMEGIRLTHEPALDATHQIIGHYHPKLQMKLGGNRVSGKCFLLADNLLVMPSFGSYTGGLDCDNPAIVTLSVKPFKRYLLYRNQVWKL